MDTALVLYIFSNYLNLFSDFDCLSFSIPGKGAADPAQPEEALCTGLGDQSEKGETTMKRKALCDKGEI